jgi:hypothetical protein
VSDGAVEGRGEVGGGSIDAEDHKGACISVNVLLWQIKKLTTGALIIRERAAGKITLSEAG